MNTPDQRPDDTEVLSTEPAPSEPGPAETDTDVVDGAAVTEPAPEHEPANETGSAATPRRKTRRALVAVGVAAVLAASGAVAAAAAHKDVQLDVDGEIVNVSSFAGDVGNVLEAQGITIAEHDLVVPGVDEPLTDGAEIVVRTAEQITVSIDGAPTQLWTVGDTAAQALTMIADSGRDATVTASRTSGRVALDLPLTSGGPVTFVVDGEDRTVEIDGVADLSTALLRAEIEVGDHDKVSVAVGEDGTPVVTITRIASQESTRTESLDFETVKQGTDDLYEGQERVVQDGHEGERTYSYVEYTVDGEVVSSQLVGTEVTTQPEDRVIEYGTAERPKPPAPTSTSSSSGSSGSGGGTVSGDVWAALAQCESGGNPATNTGNGYYGLYQFSLGTWQSVGGSGLPSDASAAEQTQRAQILQARSGWGQWPACSAKLGLR